MKYDNTTYWLSIHKQHKSELRGVGHPALSEHLNRLKYESEAKTILSCLEVIGHQLRKAGGETLSILDLGAGTGYWSNFVCQVLDKRGFSVSMTAIDISEDALESLRARSPRVKTVCADLKTINQNKFSCAFDLVMSFYCLHHLLCLDDFLNALRFVGRSVKMGGFLMIMDPVLTMPFSRLDVINFPSYEGNGIARHLYLIEDVLYKEGLLRQAVRPAVSFLLNGNIQGYDPLSYAAASIIWKGLSILYRSNRSVQLFSSILIPLDRVLKRLGLAFSSSVCVYWKSFS